jgi:hypothetical protein
MTRQSVAASMRGVVAKKPRRWRWRRKVAIAPPLPEIAPEEASLRGIGMTSGVPTFIASVRRVTRAELHELLRQAGLYIFFPLILLQCLGNVLVAVGAFDTPLLLTPA